jgi:hypothetical protein
VLTVAAGALNTDTDPDDASNVSNISLNPLQTPVSGAINGSNYAGPYRVETFDVTQDLRTAASLNNALVQIRYNGAAADNAKPKYAIVDGVEVHVTYRPPTDLRPIRGCTTIRLANSLNLSDYRGVDVVESQRPDTTDASYDDGSGTKDVQQCSLMVASNNKLGQGTKLHIAGSVYGPTAAFEFAGKDNEAQFLTDGIVARHITAMRWQQGPELPAFGGGTTSLRQPREVILEARTPGNPNPIATAKVQLTDPAGGVGRAPAVIEDWRRRP